MPRSRPASNPVSFHRPTKQYYVTRAGRRLYLGSDKGQAIKRFHEMGLGMEGRSGSPTVSEQYDLTLKELANRFLAAQQANWRNPETTLKCYRDWLARFLSDHPRLRVSAFTVEKFAAWKLSLKNRQYSVESINHYLGAVRAMFRFAEDTDLIERAPKLKRVKNQPRQMAGRKLLYTAGEVQSLLDTAKD